MATTLLSGQTVVTFAMQQIGVLAVGQQLGASEATIGLSRANAMISGLNIQNLAKLVIAREVFSVTANVGTYTIGPGADFNTTRPTALVNAGLLYGNTNPPNEIGVGLLTDQMYQAIVVKGQTGSQWTQVYYQPTYQTTGWGTVILWPIPTVDTNDLVLYFQKPLVEFADLTTQAYWPEGALEMLGYNLALRLCAPYARPVPDDVRLLARQSLATFKRNNVRMSDLSNEVAMIGLSQARYGWNANTGQY